jgi:integrase
MATITKRTWTTRRGEHRETWVVRYADQAGKWRLKSFDRKAEADSWLTDAKADVKAGTHTPDSKSETLAAACAAWIKRGEADQLFPSTMRQRRLHRDIILKLLDGDTKLSRLTPVQIETARDNLLTQPRRSKAMARKVIVSLRSILRQAKAVHLLSANVKVKAAGKKPLKVGVDLPSPAEMKAVVETTRDDPKAHALVCLAGFAGLRASELRGLAWSNIDLAKPRVTVEERADERNTIGRPKSDAGYRTVALNETTVKALKAWKLAQPHGRKLVFGTASDRPDGLANIRRRVFIPAMAKAGLSYTGLHCLRHFAVSSWLRTCCGDFKAVQVRAGHATLGLTLDTYGHLLDTNDGDQIAAAERLVLG